MRGLLHGLRTKNTGGWVEKACSTKPLFLVVVGLALGLSGLHEASASVTYSYTGNPFAPPTALSECNEQPTLFICPGGSITVSATLDIPQGYSGAWSIGNSGVGGSFVISGAGASVNSALPYANTPYYYNTASATFQLLNGAIQYWSVGVAQLFTPPAANSTVNDLGTTNMPPNTVSDGVDLWSSAGIDEQGNSNNPGTWTVASGTLQPSCAADLTGGVHAMATGPVSASGLPTDIVASFIPSTGVSLAQAAIDCNVTAFDWRQKITAIPGVNPYPKLTQGGFDPPSGGPGYLVFCSQSPAHISQPVTFPLTITKSNPSTAVANAYPYYFSLGASATDCGTVGYNEISDTSAPTTASACADFYNTGATEFGDNNLCFKDSPVDPNLPQNGALGFTTDLVGITSDGSTVDYGSLYHDYFDWADSFTGYQGDCTQTLIQQLAGTESCTFTGVNGGGVLVADSVLSNGLPGVGNGGIELLSIDGVSVPEPSTAALLIPFLWLVSMFTGRRNLNDERGLRQSDGPGPM